MRWRTGETTCNCSTWSNCAAQHNGGESITPVVVGWQTLELQTPQAERPV